jgi:hypothetical protein
MAGDLDWTERGRLFGPVASGRARASWVIGCVVTDWPALGLRFPAGAAGRDGTSEPAWPGGGQGEPWRRGMCRPTTIARRTADLLAGLSLDADEVVDVHDARPQPSSLLEPSRASCPIDPGHLARRGLQAS